MTSATNELRRCRAPNGDRLLAEGVRDVRHLRDEPSLSALCQQQVLGAGVLDLGRAEAMSPFGEASAEGAQRTPYGLGSPPE